MSTVQASTIELIFEKLTEPFGGLSQVRPSISQSQLEYISLFPGFTTIAKPWAKEVNLETKGFRPGTTYRVFDSELRFLYEVFPSIEEPFFGLDTRDLNELTYRRNGDYLHIQFDTFEGPVCGLIWIQNQIAPSLAKQQIDIWLRDIETNTPRQTEHELFASTTLLSPSRGQVVIYFIPGSWELQLSPEDILLSESEEKIITYREAGDPLVLYPNLNGWYLFLQEDANGVRSFLTLMDQYGIGTRRLRRVEQVFFFQAHNADLAPSIADTRQAIGNTGTLSWSSSEPKMRIEANLDYFSFIILTGTTTLSAYGDTNSSVECDDILATESFGGSEFLETDEYDAANFLGNFFVGADCTSSSGSNGLTVRVPLNGTTDLLVNGDVDFTLEALVEGETYVRVNGFVTVDPESIAVDIEGSNYIVASGGTQEYAESTIDEEDNESTTEYLVVSGQVLVTGVVSIGNASQLRVFAAPEDELTTELVSETTLSVGAYSENNADIEIIQTTALSSNKGNVLVSSSLIAVEGTSASIVAGAVIIKSAEVDIETETTFSVFADNSVPADDQVISGTTLVLSGSDIIHVAGSRVSFGCTRTLIEGSVIPGTT